MKKRNNALSVAIGALIGTALVIHIAEQQGIYAEARRDDLKPVAEVKVIELQEEAVLKESAEVELEETVPAPEVAFVNLGEFKLTAYCACEQCCGEWAVNRPVDAEGNPIVYGATGEVLVEGISIAVDKDVIPYGAEVLVNGRAYKAQDCGGAIKGNRIDVYFSDHADALEFGVQYGEVFMKKGEEDGT